MTRIAFSHNDNDSLKRSACEALFAMGDRSTELADAIIEVEPEDYNQGAREQTMFAQFGRKWSFGWRGFIQRPPYPQYPGATSRPASADASLPAGALYTLRRPECKDDGGYLPVILDGDERRLFVLYCGPEGIHGKQFFIWDLRHRKLLPSPLPEGTNVEQVAVSISRGLIATVEYRGTAVHPADDRALGRGHAPRLDSPLGPGGQARGRPARAQGRR